MKKKIKGNKEISGAKITKPLGDEGRGKTKKAAKAILQKDKKKKPKPSK